MKSFNKKIIITFCIVLCIALILVFKPFYKYEHIKIGELELLVRINILSGETECYNPVDGTWVLKLMESSKKDNELDINKIEVEISIIERFLENPTINNKIIDDGEIIIMKREGATEKEINNYRIEKAKKLLKDLKDKKNFAASETK